MITLFSFLGILCVGAGLAAAHFEIISLILGLGITALGLSFLILVFFSSLVDLFRRRKGETNWIALILGFFAVLASGALAYFAFQNPISDITTDVQNPPKFLFPVFPFQVEKGSEFLDPSLQIARAYDPSSAAIQATHYPSIIGLVLQCPASDAFALSIRTIKADLPDWQVVLEDAKAGHAEMQVSDPIFHYLQDVALELRQDPENPFRSKLEIRSRGRIPFSDLGLNAALVEHLKIRLEAAMKPLEQQFLAKRAEWEKAKAPQKAAAAPAEPVKQPNGAPAKSNSPAKVSAPAEKKK